MKYLRRVNRDPYHTLWTQEWLEVQDDSLACSRVVTFYSKGPVTAEYMHNFSIQHCVPQLRGEVSPERFEMFWNLYHVTATQE